MVADLHRLAHRVLHSPELLSADRADRGTPSTVYDATTEQLLDANFPDANLPGTATTDPVTTLSPQPPSAA